MLINIFIFQIIICFSVITSCLANEKSFAAWSAPDGPEVNIFYSVLYNDHWSKPLQLTIEGSNVTPAISVDSNGTIWIIWVDFVDENSFLKYAIIRDDEIVQDRVLSSALEKSFSPCIIIDRLNIPWIVWAGLNGTDEDIFYSRWLGASWSLPKQVNSDNTIPDITPTIGLGSDGRPWISWLSANGDTYDTITVYWSNSSWDRAKEGNTGNILQQIKNHRKSSPQFPTVARNRLMGSIFAGDSEEIQSVSDRHIHLMTPKAE